VPLLSIILPAYNQEKFVVEAIESILRQSLSDFELIVIDDCSNDKTFQIVSSINDSRIILVRNQENLGLTHTLNFGLSIAKSDIVARMDADDIAFSDRLHIQYEYLLKNPEVVAVGCWITLFKDNHDEIGVHKYPAEFKCLRAEFTFNNSIPHPGVMYRKSAVELLGGYTNDYPYAEDWDLWLRLIRSHNVSNIQQPLLYYRIHDRSVSHQHSAFQSLSKQRLIKDNLNSYGFTVLDDLDLLEKKFEYHKIRILYDALLSLKEQNELLKQFNNFYFTKTLQSKLDEYLLRADVKIFGCMFFYLRFRIFSDNSLISRLKFIVKLAFLFFLKKFT
jgi:glycosyltransferase involved in cell wall biosynthesis